MRKLYKYMALSLLAFSFGCQREEIAAPESGEGIHKVYATIEDINDADTRTSMSIDEEGQDAEIHWSSGDQIAVFLKNNLRKRFDITSESIGGKDATFLQDDRYNITGNNASISNNVAWYPFCDVTCVPDGISYTLSNISLPATQSYAPASVGLGAYPMVAVTADTDDVNYRFRNVCGAIIFQLEGYGFIRSVSIKGRSDEVLSGAATVTASYGKDPKISLENGGSKTVTLDCGENGVELNEATPTSFIIALPPVAFEGGFTITVTDTWGGSKEYSTTKKNPIERSKIRRMPVQEYKGVRPPKPGDYIDEYGENHGQGIEIDGVVWAPVNCGHHKTDYPYGKLYQWGRKYGQGYSGDIYDVNGNEVGSYSDATVPTIKSGPVSLSTGQSKNNENYFYTSNSTYRYDWMSTPDDKLWNLGAEDNPVKTEYDPCPDGWRVPTRAELNELYKNHSSWTSEDGQNGYWFSGASSYTETVSQVFFSATGYRDDYSGDADKRGYYGAYWSSKPCNYGDAYGLYFNDVYTDVINGRYRADGNCIRCVKDDSELISVESVALNKTSFTLSTGSSETLSAAIAPLNANHQSAHWWSDDPSIATVDQNGKVKAISAGTVIITAMAGMQTAECEVTVITLKDYVDEYNENRGKGILIDGVVWAPVNCGYKPASETDKGYPYGKLYQWGRKYGQGYNDNNYSDATYPSGGNLVQGPVDQSVGQAEENADKFYYTSSVSDDWCVVQNDKLWNSGTDKEPVKTEYDPCPTGWRIPTFPELEMLSQNNSPLTTYEDKIGSWFSGTSPYNSSVSQIFLPCAGEREKSYGDAFYRHRYGFYWASNEYGEGYANRLSFGASDAYVGGNRRAYASSVRCVQVTD